MSNVCKYVASFFYFNVYMLKYKMFAGCRFIHF